MRCFYSDYNKDLLQKARNVILVDNVIDSGTTYEQARAAIKEAYGVDAWLLTLGAVIDPIDKSKDVIRSIYDKRGKGFYESKMGGCPGYILTEEEMFGLVKDIVLEVSLGKAVPYNFQ